MSVKNLFIIAGCNGAGKTTASFTILPRVINCKEFVNADEIARGISPFQPEKVAFESERIMLQRIDELLNQNESFAFETTLSSKTYQFKIKETKQKGFTTTLLYFWLQSVELARERVRIRVAEGGHDISPDIIKRRYFRGISNLFKVYLPIVDGAFIFYNSAGNFELLAQKNFSGEIDIINKEKIDYLRSYENQS